MHAWSSYVILHGHGIHWRMENGGWLEGLLNGPNNPCELTSADSKYPESAIWSSRQCLPVLGSTPTLRSTIGLTAGSVEHSPLHQWKAFHGGHLHFKERTFSKSVNTFDNYMQCLFFIWWDLPTLKWTGATLCTLTMDIMWLLILILTCFCCLLPASVIA